MQRLSDILPKITARYQLDESATASQILEVAEQYLKEIFDEDNVGREKNIFPQKLKNGVLFCEVSSSGWNHSLFLKKEDVLSHLKSQFPSCTITDIRGIVKGVH